VSVLVVEGVCAGLWCGGRSVALLSDVSLDVERGEVVAVVGGRLSGKTSLLAIAAGVALPERGSVRLGGRELTGLSSGERARLRGRDREVVWLNRVGMAQRLKVSKMVGWPVLFGGGREAARRVGQMLERVGALDCAEKRWADLSPWEQLLVGLARAFVADPKLVVVDDLLDALGPPATTEASRLLRSLIAESESRCGVLMSVSGRDSAIYADRAWSLGSGGKLTPTSGHHDSEADIIPLRPQRGESGGSRRVG
jgi:putative ABC transport system ATP-binding protein